MTDFYAEANAILDTCTHDGRFPLYTNRAGTPSGQLACVDCYNAHVYARRAARKVELAAIRADKPPCQRCGLKPVTWTYGPYKLCGRCKTATAREHSQKAASAGFIGLLAHGGPMVDTSQWAARKQEEPNA